MEEENSTLTGYRIQTTDNGVNAELCVLQDKVVIQRQEEMAPMDEKSHEKVRIRFFEPFGRSRVFHFSLGTFGEVEDLPGPLGALDETYTQSKLDISGSNETYAKHSSSNSLVLADFLNLFYFSRISKI